MKKSERNLFYESDNGAEFSEDRKYRYTLWRIWDNNKPMVMFIGLNPSTANETTNDPTICRVIKFAFDWGFGGVYMTNLFAYVTPYPEKLKECNDPLADNDSWLEKTAHKCKKIIFAWGSFKEAAERSKEVMQMFDGYALIINKDGSPRHPLYIKSDVIPVLMKVTNKT